MRYRHQPDRGLPLAARVLRGMMKSATAASSISPRWSASPATPGQMNYAAAKAGVAGMSRALAREIGSRNITVNCVAPGFIDTDMTRALARQQNARCWRRFRWPAGHAGGHRAAVAFLASPQAGYITGTELHVNGGMYMS